MLDLAAADWRDLLVTAGLAGEDWQRRLNIEFGDLPEQATGRPYRLLGFSPAYSCHVDPELPGDGDWGCPVHGFDRDGGRASEPFHSRWGAPMIVRFTLSSGGTWIGIFEAGGLGGVDGVFACPNPVEAMVICDGRAYLVDVSKPEGTAVISFSPITQASSAGTDLIVLASFSNLTAIGPYGQAWASERLCLDNLKIVSASADGIDCTGDFIGCTESFTVDAHTGTLKAGRRFLDTWPGQ
jgi:hypothetical protein